MTDVDIEDNLLLNRFYYFYPKNVGPYYYEEDTDTLYDYIVIRISLTAIRDDKDLPCEIVLDKYKLNTDYYGFVCDKTFNKVTHVQLKRINKPALNLGPLRILTEGSKDLCGNCQFVEKKQKIITNEQFITHYYLFQAENYYRGIIPTDYCILTAEQYDVTEENCKKIPRCLGLIPDVCLIGNMAQFQPWVKNPDINSQFILYPGKNRCTKSDSTSSSDDYKIVQDLVVASAIECQEACRLERNFVCKGFEWDDNELECYLWKTKPFPSETTNNIECFYREFFKPYREKVTVHSIHKKFVDKPGLYIPILLMFILIAIGFRFYKKNDPFKYYYKKLKNKDPEF